MYSAIFLCDELLKFVKEQGFKESTLVRYRRSLDGFIKFCNDRDVINYTPEIGQEFANDLIPKGKIRCRLIENVLEEKLFSTSIIIWNMDILYLNIGKENVSIQNL